MKNNSETQKKISRTRRLILTCMLLTAIVIFAVTTASASVNIVLHNDAHCMSSDCKDLKAVMEKIDNLKMDIFMSMAVGDEIERSAKLSILKSSVDMCKKITAIKCNYAIGNHEDALGANDWRDATGMESENYVIDTDWGRIIVMNTGSSFSSSGLKWLEKEVNVSSNIVVFNHYPLGGTNYDSDNSEEVRKVLEKHGNVLVVWGGHNHQNTAKKINGIWYITQDALRFGAWSIVSLGDSSINVTGYGSVESRSILIPTTTSLPTPVPTPIETPEPTPNSSTPTPLPTPKNNTSTPTPVPTDNSTLTPMPTPTSVPTPELTPEVNSTTPVPGNNITMPTPEITTPIPTINSTMAPTPIITPVEIPHASYGGGSSGGANGGGGIISCEAYDNIKAPMTIDADVSININPMIYNFTNRLGFIKDISFTPHYSQGTVTVKGELLRNKSACIENNSSEIDGEEIIYFNIWVGLSGYGNSEKISNRTILFEMPYGLTKKNAKMFVYKDGNWTDVKYEVVSNGLYLANTSFFGNFALSKVEKEEYHEALPKSKIEKISLNAKKIEQPLIGLENSESSKAKELSQQTPALSVASLLFVVVAIYAGRKIKKF